MNIYLELTRQFNAKGRIAVLAGGQAAVLHRLAFMSKDGDWILKETGEAMEHILNVLSDYKAHYRFGAPLDIRWMSGGWSSHLEFHHQGLRVRTDFFTRPPRLSAEDIRLLWQGEKDQDYPFVNARLLAEMKKTNREKDYPFIGELARLMTSAKEQILYSRSARDLIRFAGTHPELVKKLACERTVLNHAFDDIESLETALDAERRKLIRDNENRLQRYMDAASVWHQEWPKLHDKIQGLPLMEAHQIMVEYATNRLPFKPTNKLPFKARQQIIFNPEEKP